MGGIAMFSAIARWGRGLLRVGGRGGGRDAYEGHRHVFCDCKMGVGQHWSVWRKGVMVVCCGKHRHVVVLCSCEVGEVGEGGAGTAEQCRVVKDGATQIRKVFLLSLCLPSSTSTPFPYALTPFPISVSVPPYLNHRDDRAAEKAASSAVAALKLHLSKLLLHDMVTMRTQGVYNWKKHYDTAVTMCNQAIAGLAAREAGEYRGEGGREGNAVQGERQGGNGRGRGDGMECQGQGGKAGGGQRYWGGKKGWGRAGAAKAQRQ